MNVRNLLAENKVLVSLNVVLVGCFVAYNAFLDSNYCLSADDFAGIYFGSKGIPGFSYAWRFYFEWEGPFLSHFTQGLLFGLIAKGVPQFIGLLVVKLAMVGSTATLIAAISKRIQLHWESQKIVFAALIFNITLYVISPNQSEIWHWLVGSVYLTPLIFLQLGTASLLRGKFWWSIAAFAFVMQSRATYAVVVFGFIVLLSIFNWWQKEENRKQWVLLSAFLLLFLVLYLIAPGNYVRLKEHGNAVPFLITQFKIGIKNLFVSYNIAKLNSVFLGCLAVFPWVVYQQGPSISRQLWQWAIPAILYAGFAIVHETLFVYITGYREWTRVLSLHSFLFLSTMFIYGFWSFSYVPVSWKKKLQYASIIGIGGLLFQFFNDFGHQLEIGKELKTKYDARMAYILDYRGVADTLYVQPMNYEGILYFEDFSEDPDNWINKDFVKAYNLDFKVALKKQDEK